MPAFEPSFPARSRRGPAPAIGQGAREEGRLIAYSAGNLGKNIVFASGELTFLYLLTDLAGLSGRVAGGVMLLVVLGDLVFDLLAARIVIHLRARAINYASLLVAGAVPGGLAFAMVYALPALGVTASGWLALALVTFRSAYALVDVPHNALMARISQSSRTRARISGYRRFFSSLSSVSIALIIAPGVEAATHGDDYPALAAMGLGVGALFVAAMGACAWACRTRHPARVEEASAHADPCPGPVTGDGLAVPLRDPLVLAMLALGLLTGFAAPGFDRMVLYFARYVLAEPEAVRPVLLAVTVGQFAGVLAWTALAGRIDARRLLIAGHLLYALALCGFWLASPLAGARLGLAGVIGFAQTAVFMLPWAMLADVVDAVEWRHRRRFEAGLFAVFLVVVKSSGSAASAVIGFTLDRAGYAPGLVQDAGVRAVIAALGIALPVAGSALAAALLWRFRLGHALHARLCRTLAYRRRTGVRVVGPQAAQTSGFVSLRA
ncbi:MFS transporter [Novosphingobium sp. 1949]|uniref:MFS transporter n=1 Tax=Novosphingobium organovorum TaxID=2930092 RepID=A0ABT0BIC1_9SPHN|nr:MFS transporter [Novosphingobium organovorum]MCJ2184806.1 MFS transporter [Novosphingobium organovorum]